MKYVAALSDIYGVYIEHLFSKETFSSLIGTNSDLDLRFFNFKELKVEFSCRKIRKQKVNQQQQKEGKQDILLKWFQFKLHYLRKYYKIKSDYCFNGVSSKLLRVFPGKYFYNFQL